MISRLLVLILLVPFTAFADDYVVTKTYKWSLLDRIAQALCEAERDDCNANSQCGQPDESGMIACTLRMPQETIWQALYRDKARRALEAIK